MTCLAPPITPCDLTSKLSANGTTDLVRNHFSASRTIGVEISLAPRCQWTRGNLPVHGTDVWTIASKLSNLRLSK